MAFFQNAFLAAVLLSLLFGIVSFFIVMRRMAFMGSGIAHTAFGGVALGLVLGINPFYTSLIFCVLAAWLMRKIAREANVGIDTGIGIFFAFSMALGSLLLALYKEYTFDLSGYLFGNILGVRSIDLLLVCGTALIFLPLFFIFLNRILFMTFDVNVARISGVPTQILDTLITLMLAVLIVVSIRLVGIILVSALIVLPASFGLAVSDNYRRILGLGVLYSFIVMTGGLMLSHRLDTPAGATMVTFGTLIYFSTLLFNRLRLSADQRDNG